jgi:nucleotide-binding universal stress UspA family protein
MFVNDPLLVAAARAASDPRGHQERAERDLRWFVSHSISRRLLARTTQLVSLGKPAQEICRAAHDLRVDLIVMGTQGVRGPRKLFFGSTTESVLRRTRLPLLAVPIDPAQARRRR